MKLHVIGGSLKKKVKIAMHDYSLPFTYPPCVRCLPQTSDEKIAILIMTTKLLIKKNYNRIESALFFVISVLYLSIALYVL